MLRALVFEDAVFVVPESTKHCCKVLKRRSEMLKGGWGVASVFPPPELVKKSSGGSQLKLPHVPYERLTFLVSACHSAPPRRGADGAIDQRKGSCTINSLHPRWPMQ